MSGQQERKTPEGTSYKDLVLTVTSVTTSIITTNTTKTNSSLAFNIDTIDKVGVFDILISIFFNLRQKGKYSLKCL